jgi:hypothetical protein
LLFRFQGGGAAAEEEEEEGNQPLDLSWPESWRERVTYLLVLPIIIPLWLTLPDTRKESGQEEEWWQSARGIICTLQLAARILVRGTLL